jgi:hypothetical protein
MKYQRELTELRMHIGKERPATNIPTQTSQNKAGREHY